MTILHPAPPVLLRSRRSRAVRRVAVAWHGLPDYAATLLDLLICVHPELEFSLLATASGDFQKHPVRDWIGGVRVRRIEEDHPLTWAHLRTPPPDLFVFTSWNHPSHRSLAADARRAGRTRLVCMVDNILQWRLRQLAGAVWFRALMRPRLDYVWTPGARARRFAQFLGMPPERIVEGLYGADPAIFSDSSSDCEEPRQGVLFVGQLIERKGIPALVEAARRQPRFAAELQVIGHGPLAPTLRAAGIRVRDFMPAAELAAHYRRASMLILPSRIDHWGVVLHEGALSGCLLAATARCGASDDLIAHGRNGFVMHESTPEEVLRAVAWAERLPAEHVRDAREHSRRLAESFGPAAFARAFERFLRDPA